MFSHRCNIFANYDSSFLIYIFIQRGAFHLTKFLYIESYVVSKNGKHMLPHILQEINNNKLKLMSVQRRWKGLFCEECSLLLHWSICAWIISIFFSFMMSFIITTCRHRPTYMFSFLCNIQPFNKACRMIKPLQHFCRSREGSTCKNFMNHNLPMRHNHIHIKNVCI